MKNTLLDLIERTNMEIEMSKKTNLIFNSTQKSLSILDSIPNNIKSIIVEKVLKSYLNSNFDEYLEENIEDIENLLVEYKKTQKQQRCYSVNKNLVNELKTKSLEQNITFSNLINYLIIDYFEIKKGDKK